MWVRVLAVGFLVSVALLGPFRARVFKEPFSRVVALGSEGATFDWEGPDAPKSAGGVFSLDPSRPAGFWGTQIEGRDDFTGDVVLSGEWPRGFALNLPVTGNVAKPNSLRVRALGEDGLIVREWTHPEIDIGIEVRVWKLDGASAVIAKRIEVLLSDHLSGQGGWLGVGRLVRLENGDRMAATNFKPAANFGFFLAHVFAIAGFLFLPGLALRTLKQIAGLSVALIPVPGLGLLVVAGVALWFAGPSVMGGFAITFTLLHTAFAIAVLLRRAGDFRADEARAIHLYLALVVALIAWSAVPLPVEREYFEGTNARGRMVASPPDVYIPFFTAAYFLHDREAGAEDSRYFGHEWSATSRGPLAAWMIAASVEALGFKPGNPPVIAAHAWPADREGFFVGRILGILTNGLVILGGMAALSALGRSRREAICFGLGWLALSPVVLINVSFLWPKMLATYFGLMAIAEAAGRRRAWSVGGWLALAYLAHPVGILIAASVLAWKGAIGAQAFDRFKERIIAFVRGSVPSGLWMIAFAAPWLAHKMMQPQPELFLRYPFGDGRGLESALSFGSWLACRWDNLWYSVVPGALWWSGLSVIWAGGSLSTAGHWAMNCAKTLPFGLGIALFPLAVWTLFRRGDRMLVSFRIWMLGGGLLLMLVVWGFSHDGLGRNCLEPLVVCVILATAVAVPRIGRLHKILLAVVALEGTGLLASAYLANPDFSARLAEPAAWITLGITGIAWAWLAILALASPGEDIASDVGN